MEQGQNTNNTGPARKHRFAPKAPPRRAPKPEVKAEKKEDAEVAMASDLLRRFNERSTRFRPKSERKIAANQIAFGYGGASASIKSYGGPKCWSGGKDQGGANAPGLMEKEYKEPWDYYNYYPVTLPLRRPYSGNPEHLDEQEFGETAKIATYDENATNSAVDLGLLEENLEASMFFLQLPPTFPMLRRSATTDGHGAKDSSGPPGRAHAKVKPCGLDDLTAGIMGKMIVYRSGAVKLKLGDTLYDVSPGMDCMFAQDVVAVNTVEKQCCVVAELNNRATITPDVDTILSSMADL
ncbi:DNA-directed RNA polymerase III subunit rpc4 [Tripterygium wilfordii]|uniref:DNA-directed RNA polymerase III subunit rpc4 n=1 Tax=Tripterygium wilfordii TaxID=458696 RepID=A0A7J7BX30_TRIWF|nr:uncharacterized protein LOC119993853 isoform X2 [Tripterygium wilfordii]KAF5726096.1 DNA-directed RNA polymerase III subunit rpc4 [Tripterygium wilfordii]